MFRVTSVLIALSLVAAPTASLACDWWCANPAAQQHYQMAGCHGVRSQVDSARAQISAPDVDCHEALWTSPAAIEARIAGKGLLSIVMPRLPVVSSAGTVADAPASACIFDARTPRAALHTILRI